MTTQETEQRANRHGSQCPHWCSIDHARVLDGKPGRMMDSHFSDPMTSGALPWDVKVKLYQHADRYGEDKPKVELIAMCSMLLVDPQDAVDLAELLDSLANEPPARLRELADQVRAAAAILQE